MNQKNLFLVIKLTAFQQFLFKGLSDSNYESLKFRTRKIKLICNYCKTDYNVYNALCMIQKLLNRMNYHFQFTYLKLLYILVKIFIGCSNFF